jgi:hypothetical protein
MDMPATTERVPLHTKDRVNREIEIATACRLKHFAEHPDQIDGRLRELDEEWDVERTLEANASTLALTGLVFGSVFDRKFLLLTGGVLAFLCQHALRGWCPPLPILRRMGFRTQKEIETERHGLRVLRGDFDDDRGSGEHRPNLEKGLRVLESR